MIPSTSIQGSLMAMPGQQLCAPARVRRRGEAGRLGSRTPGAIADVAATGIALQNMIVGGAVLGAVGAALYSGLRAEPTVCSLCQGTGGTRCFACEGGGKNQLIKREDLYSDSSRPSRDPLRRSRNPRECRVCKGLGMVLCSQCKGSGYA